MANRNGGLLVYGVDQVGGGAFDPVGLDQGDQLPDATEIGQSLRKWFDLPPVIEAAMFDIGGKRFGVIDVREFRKVPHVAKGANDELNRPRLRPGEDYRRPDLVPEHPDRPRKLLALAPPSYRAACDALAAIAGTGGRSGIAQRESPASRWRRRAGSPMTGSLSASQQWGASHHGSPRSIH